MLSLRWVRSVSSYETYSDKYYSWTSNRRQLCPVIDSRPCLVLKRLLTLNQLTRISGSDCYDPEERNIINTTGIALCVYGPYQNWQSSTNLYSSALPLKSFRCLLLIWFDLNGVECLAQWIHCLWLSIFSTHSVNAMEMSREHILPCRHPSPHTSAVYCLSAIISTLFHTPKPYVSNHVELVHIFSSCQDIAKEKLYCGMMDFYLDCMPLSFNQIDFEFPWALILKKSMLSK